MASAAMLSKRVLVRAGTNNQKSKQALFKIDKAPWVEKWLRHRTLPEAF